MFIKRFWLALLALTLLAGCGAVQEGGIEPLSPTPDPAEAIVRITYRDGTVEHISQNELNAFAQRFANLAGQELPPAVALDLLMQRNLMLYLARITNTQADTAEVERIVRSVTGEGGFCTQLVPRTDVDSRTYLDQCAQALGLESGIAFRNFVAEELTIEQVARQEAPADLFRTAHILFPEDGYAGAAQAYDRLQRFPNQFAEIAREQSIDPGSREQGGELPPFDEQGLTQQGQQFDTTFVSNTLQLREEFERTGDAISEPFQTDFGWHIIRLLGFEASQQNAGQFRDAVLQRALEAQPGDLAEPDTGDVPLLASIEFLQDVPTPEPVATPEILPEVPVEPEASPAPEETPVPIEDGAAPDETPEPLDQAPEDEAEPVEPEASPSP